MLGLVYYTVVLDCIRLYYMVFQPAQDNTFEFCTYHGLIFISGMGAHVKKTVSSKKDFRPHTSDSAPISGALRNDNRP